MENTAHRAIAIVGVGAILPDAPNAPAFWNNVKTGRYSISEVPADRWDPERYLRCRSQRARQDVFEDRRLGARVCLGPDEVEASDSAARGGRAWTWRNSGRSPARAKRWKTTDIPIGR